MSTFSFGTVAGNVQVGDYNVQNNSGTSSYGFGTIARDVSADLSWSIAELEAAGAAETRVRELTEKKDELVALVSSVWNDPHCQSKLVEKTAEFARDFRSVSESLGCGFDTAEKLAGKMGKLLPVLVPAV